jgi:hypothetical protein
LIFHFKSNFVILSSALGGTELFLRAQERVIRTQTEKAAREGNSVLKVGFHLDVTCLPDVALCRPIANNAWGLSEVGVIRDDLHSSTLCHCDFAG